MGPLAGIKVIEMKGIGASRLVGEAQGKELQPLVGILDVISTPTHTHL